MATDPEGRRGILVALDVLVVGDPNTPRPVDSAGSALDRLDWIGRPVVLAGRELLGRRLPEATADRVAWVRASFERDDLEVHPFDEPEADRAEELANAVKLWAAARELWRADWLLTSRAATVGAARRADLAVARIGPRDPDGAAAVERADYDARDLLDAVGYLLTRDAFAAGRPG
jgi:hypothetical protein